MLQQEGPFLVGLDAFRNNVQAKTVGQTRNVSFDHCNTPSSRLNTQLPIRDSA